MIKTAAVIILFNIEKIGQDKILQNINSYSHFFDKLYIVDNSNLSHLSLFENLQNFEYIQNFDENGIAGAQNKGCEKALNDGFEWAMTMDEDSYFEEPQISEYIKLFNQYSEIDNSIKSFSMHILNCNKNFFLTEEIRRKILSPLKRKLLKKKADYKTDSTDQTIEYPKRVIASGNIINLQAWNKVGRFDNSLFIDEVDHDFCHRLTQEKYKIIRFNTVHINHSLGGSSFAIFKKHYVNYSDFRLFYIYRNTLIERYRFPVYHDFYTTQFKNILFDTLINTVHPFSHMITLRKAIKAYRIFLKEK